ncbi:hypothetical protein ABE438_05250 [Bosea sp. TWI1241]|uniref:hypothetical protein n=1 Tax=Bosea sp. TWI1241 TaxID=3148904 RepID=UPI003208F4F6
MEPFIEAIGAGGMLALLAVAGAVLGGALGHWFAKPGRKRMISGAIMGALALPLGAIALTVHLTALLIGAFAMAAAVVVGGFLG